MGASCIYNKNSLHCEEKLEFMSHNLNRMGWWCAGIESGGFQGHFACSYWENSLFGGTVLLSNKRK